MLRDYQSASELESETYRQLCCVNFKLSLVCFCPPTPVLVRCVRGHARTNLLPKIQNTNTNLQTHCLQLIHVPLSVWM